MHASQALIALALLGLLSGPLQANPSALRDEGTKTCSGGSVTRAGTGAFVGKARLLLLDANFARHHVPSTRGEEAWLAHLAGYSTRNLVFTSRSGQKVIVAAVCPAKGCTEQRAYVAYDSGRQLYGATVIEGRHVREIVPGAEDTSLAMHPQTIGDALYCARELAESQR